MQRKIQRGERVKTEAADRSIEILGLFRLGAMPVSDGTLITSDLNFIRLFRDRSLYDINIGLINKAAAWVRSSRR